MSSWERLGAVMSIWEQLGDSLTVVWSNCEHLGAVVSNCERLHLAFNSWKQLKVGSSYSWPNTQTNSLIVILLPICMSSSCSSPLCMSIESWKQLQLAKYSNESTHCNPLTYFPTLLYKCASILSPILFKKQNQFLSLSLFYYTEAVFGNNVLSSVLTKSIH